MRQLTGIPAYMSIDRHMNTQPPWLIAAVAQKTGPRARARVSMFHGHEPGASVPVPGERRLPVQFPILRRRLA